MTTSIAVATNVFVRNRRYQHCHHCYYHCRCCHHCYLIANTIANIASEAIAPTVFAGMS